MSPTSQEIAQTPVVGLGSWRRFAPLNQTITLVAGLLLILAGNIILRKNLERTPLPDYYMLQAYHSVPFWKLLLPLDWGEVSDDPEARGVVHWCTSGLIAVQLLAQHFPLTKIFYAFNVALIVGSFGFSWWMSRSVVFTFTLTICMAFGTQFHWAYANSAILSLYLFTLYLEANLLCLVKLLQTGSRRWQVGFVLTLIPVALCGEFWLDYFAFLTLGSAFLLVYAWRAQAVELKPRAWFALGASWAIAATYFAIRLSHGQQQYRLGHESEMIFTYTSPVLAIEDFISNVITYVYLAFSNYLPPFMTSSNSLYILGADRIVAEQHGYHEAKGHLVPMHHLFYWYFWAGIVFAIFVYYLIRNARTALTQRSLPHVYLTMAMLLVLCGVAIHALVKFRPYLSVPLLTYKCVVSNVGVAFLLAYCLMYARDRLPLKKLLYPVLVLLIWSVIGYGAIARPHYLSHLSTEVGLSPIPDPRRNLPGAWFPGMPSQP